MFSYIKNESMVFVMWYYLLKNISNISCEEELFSCHLQKYQQYIPDVFLPSHRWPDIHRKS